MFDGRGFLRDMFTLSSDSRAVQHSQFTRAFCLTNQEMYWVLVSSCASEACSSYSIIGLFIDPCHANVTQRNLTGDCFLFIINIVFR